MGLLRQCSCPGLVARPLSYLANSRRTQVLFFSLVFWYAFDLMLDMNTKRTDDRLNIILQRKAVAFHRTGRDSEPQKKSVPVDSFPKIDLTNSKKVQHKVLLFTYMRGGSTFLGELFHQNPSACYWFEPCEGMYKSLYGTLQRWRPLDIYYFQTGAKRKQTEEEIKFLATELRDILNSDLDRLPLQILNSRWSNPQLTSATTMYRSCLKKSKITPQLGLEKCEAYIKKVCKHGFSSNTWQECSEIVTKANTHANSKRPLPDTVHRYSMCLKNIKARTDRCFPYLYNKCANRSISAVKVIRMHMGTIKEMLRLDPTIKVVHSIRDPRGIINSRNKIKVLAKVANNDMVTEAKYLCDKMVTDIKIRKELEKAFPDNFVTVRYEDFADEPEKFAPKLYFQLKIPFHEALEKWIVQNTQGNTNKKGLFSTKRKNSSMVASKWKREIPHETAMQMGLVCKELLDEMKYDFE